MNRSRLALVIALAALAVAAAACGGSDGENGDADAAPAPAPQPSDAAAPSAGAAIPGGGLSIEEATASPLEGPLMVNGYLVALDGEDVQLCSMLAESYPPQCGGPSLMVNGLHLETVDGLVQPDDPALAGTAWSEEPVSILGDIEDGVITVSETSI